MVALPTAPPAKGLAEEIAIGDHSLASIGVGCFEYTTRAALLDASAEELCIARANG
jgi:hypothetical protein